MLRKYASLFLFLFLSLSAVAQTTSFITYGVEQGLVQSQVQSLVQDDDGNLWIGTLAGLSRYNGLTFENFSKKDGLAEDWVTTSYKDSKGDIWFGHWAGSVSRYSIKTKKFESLNLEEYTRFHTVTAITEDEQGFVWIATEGSGIFIYDPVKNKKFALNVKDGLASANVYDLALDKSGNMWIATDHGITICDTKGDISSPASFVDFNSARGFVSDVITSLELSNDGTEMWVGTGDKGVIVLQLPAGFVNRNAPTLVPAMRSYASAQGTGSDFIEAIKMDSKGNIWIGTTGGGASKITPSPTAKNRLDALDHAIVKNYNTKQGLNYFNVNAILEDREGNVWIGTDVGLNQYRGERFQLFDRQDGLNNDIVWATLSDHEGNVWLGTNDGLTKLTFFTVEGTGERKFSAKNYSTADGLGSNVILSLYEDDQHNMWVGTGFGGVSKLANGETKFETYSTKDGLASDVVYAINSDAHGNLWFGTKEGASRFDPVLKTFRNYTVEDGLGGNNVYRIFRDSRDNIWFGALGGYLSVYDGQGFTKYDESSGIVHRFILAIDEDNEHNIWFGAYGGGVYEYDGRVFTNYTMKNGLSTESPYAIICDNDNNIWVGNSRGLDLFDRKDSTFSHYGRSEGFLGVEVNPNAASLNRDGSLWFGTIMGAVKFDPKQNIRNKVEPVTAISGLKIFMRDADFPDEGKFSYDQNHLTFVFAGVSLTNPEKVKYQYMLEGFDKDWSPVPTHLNEAVYSNLSPGEYTFMVKACNNDGEWNKAAVEYKFYIRPPFWQTATFYVIMVLVVIFLIYGFDKWRTSNLKKQKRVLEEKVEERTLELALKNEELALRNKEVMDSIRYAKRLQDTMLLPSREMRKAIPDSFILYKPKDIVSGDFYFYRPANVNGKRKVFIAAVDCTGHGVPGAFMSILTNDMIVAALNGHESETPAQLLDRLNKEMSDKMRHTIDDIQVRDGVDIALVSLDLDTLEMKYSGAFNPIYMFRGKQFTEYKADKISIGGFKEENAKSYSDTTVQLQSGDTIYLFSDGYADQFGGPQGKKFKLSQMKALLLNMQDQEMIDQHRILDQTIETWKGTYEQVDDMLVIGVRV
ncbi:MAG TPA: two-component regulator propeller domain-containing protein [Bacteroidia bacterium]|jgi:ligand-binding sensor domain-containing protein/serine phosphatase RsbU (regulator of sigma subunit)|nr:two-component regulator propeller domain-containing protein [Bacteroidia bacterium]